MNMHDIAIHCEAKNLIMRSVGGVVVVCMGATQAIIDATDLATIAPFKWSATNGRSGPTYARAYVGGGRSGATYRRMHRLILDVRSKMDIDHINGDGLDNRRCNLRVVSRADNLINTGAFSSSKSGVRGVCWYPAYSKWRAYIMVDRKTKTLGYFDLIEDAAAARKAAEDRYFPGAKRRS